MKIVKMCMREDSGTQFKKITNAFDLSIDLSKLIATSPSYSLKKKSPIRRYITRVW